MVLNKPLQKNTASKEQETETKIQQKTKTSKDHNWDSKGSGELVTVVTDAEQRTWQLESWQRRTRLLITVSEAGAKTVSRSGLQHNAQKSQKICTQICCG